MKNDETTLKVGEKLIDARRREFTITRIEEVKTPMDEYKVFYTDRTPLYGEEDYFCEDDRCWSEYQTILSLRTDPEKKRFVVTCAGGDPVISDSYDEREYSDYRRYAFIVNGEPQWEKRNLPLLRPHEKQEIIEICNKYKKWQS